MKSLILALAAVLMTFPTLGQSNAVSRAATPSLSITNTNDPVELDYQKLLAQDDRAQEEVQAWIRESESFKEKGIGDPRTTLRNRIHQRLDPVGKAYNDFLDHHPDHVRARLAYGSFLSDMGDEDRAFDQWQKARDLDPKNPAAWNNLGLIYGHHRGPVTNAFQCFEKAIELKPDEPVYYQNLADHVYLFRMDATNYYRLTETEVFDKALALYQQACKLDPDNFVLASEYAQSFYGTKPPRLKDGLKAWEQTLKIAKTELEREGVLIHMARIKILLGRLDEARMHLDAVTNETYASTKKTVNRNLTNALAKLSATNTPAAQAK